MTTTTVGGTMSEADLQASVIELAHLFGWRCAHFRAAQTAHGWRTPVSADGKGWPDLTLVRGDRLVFAEMKSARGTVTDDQQEWLRVLTAVAEVHIWRPADWADGTIESVLRSHS